VVKKTYKICVINRHFSDLYYIGCATMSVWSDPQEVIRITVKVCFYKAFTNDSCHTLPL